ncbi:MAG: transposase, partial [Methanobacterium sp.]
DYRIYRKESDDKTKNDHLQDMLKRAFSRGFSPLYVLIDSWYSSISNLKLVRGFSWNFICSLKSNRKINVIQGNYIPIADLDLAEKQVRKVWLKEFGFILVCKIVDKNGDIMYLATSDLTLQDYDNFVNHYKQRWKIETVQLQIRLFNS